MTVTLEVPKEIEAQMLAEAQARGVALSDYVREFILERYQEDLEEARIAEARLNDPQPALTSGQMRTNLGLDS